MFEFNHFDMVKYPVTDMFEFKIFRLIQDLKYIFEY